MDGIGSNEKHWYDVGMSGCQDDDGVDILACCVSR